MDPDYAYDLLRTERNKLWERAQNRKLSKRGRENYRVAIHSLDDARAAVELMWTLRKTINAPAAECLPDPTVVAPAMGRVEDGD